MLIKSGCGGIVIAERTAERRPDRKFDGLWKFLHVSNPAFRPFHSAIGEHGERGLQIKVQTELEIL